MFIGLLFLVVIILGWLGLICVGVFLRRDFDVMIEVVMVCVYFCCVLMSLGYECFIVKYVV